MIARLLRNQHGFLHPFWAKLFINIYAPFLGAGIRMKYLSADCKDLRVEMPFTWYNRNYVGVQFGGSIYAMTDPFYMFMLIQILGRDYVVWDKAANVDFIKPGKSRLTAKFQWTDAELELIRAKTASGDKFLYDKEVLIHDRDGELIACVIKTLYVRKKQLARSQK